MCENKQLFFWILLLLNFDVQSSDFKTELDAFVYNNHSFIDRFRAKRRLELHDSLAPYPQLPHLLPIESFISIFRHINSAVARDLIFFYKENDCWFIKIGGKVFFEVFLSEVSSDFIVIIWRKMCQKCNWSPRVIYSLLEEIYYTFGENAFLLAFEHFSSETYQAFVARTGLDFLLQKKWERMAFTQKIGYCAVLAINASIACGKDALQPLISRNDVFNSDEKKE